MRRSRQGELPLHRGTWGGRRPGAGRKPGPNPPIPHESRTRFPERHPCHVTLKVRPGLPLLRRGSVVREVERTFRRGAARSGFRLAHYSIQDDHLHAIVEAEGRDALGRGMKSLAARFARAVNRALKRKGPVLRERYHLSVLRTPKQVRNALRYVLLNATRHLAKRLGTRDLRVRVLHDPASSARWFDGWRRGSPPAAPDPPAVVPAETWLLKVGWRRWGLLDPADVPGAS